MGRENINTQRIKNIPVSDSVPSDDDILKYDDATGSFELEEDVTGEGGGGVDTAGTPEDNDYAKFTDADTIEGRSYTEVKQDLSLDNVENTAHSSDAHTMEIDGRDVSVDGAKLDGIAEGADVTADNETSHADVLVDGDIGSAVLAQQTIGIANDNLVEIDDTDAANNDYAKFTANGLEGRSYAEVRSDINVADGATANDTDANLKNRANHTGTQAAATISDFDTEVSNNDDVSANTSARHNESHTVASHSDTTATGAELEELTDGSETTLHSHAGGSSKEYASFYLSTGGVTSVAATATTLTINQTSVNSDGAVFSLSSSQVTVNKTGVFEISYQCYFNTGGSSRSEYTVWLEQDTVEVPGSRAGTYQRGYDSGDTAAGSIMISVTSGEVFRLRIQRTDGGATTGYQDNNGTRLSFKEL
jgi:hypothetical protein